MTPIFMAVAIAVVGCFALGTIVNVRRGTALMRWMQSGLPRLGTRTTVRWLGTTAVEMRIDDAKEPFRQVVLVIFLEPRDMPWMWALARWRGRRDTIILRGQLRATAPAELEVLDRASWSGREALRRVGETGWKVREPSGPGDPAVYHAEPAGLARADAMLERARSAALGVRRLSVRRSDPQFQLHVTPPSAASSAREFFEAVAALAGMATAPAARSPSVRS